jgi:hypothetical protein
LALLGSLIFQNAVFLLETPAEVNRENAAAVRYRSGQRTVLSSSLFVVGILPAVAPLMGAGSAFSFSAR